MPTDSEALNLSRCKNKRTREARSTNKPKKSTWKKTLKIFEPRPSSLQFLSTEAKQFIDEELNDQEKQGKANFFTFEKEFHEENKTKEL